MVDVCSAYVKMRVYCVCMVNSVHTCNLKLWARSLSYKVRL